MGYSKQQKTFLANIRCGLKPVRKVYLNGKVVWECDQICGDTNIPIQSEGVTRSSIRKGITDNVQIKVREKLQGRALSSLLITSSQDIDLPTKSLTRLIQAIDSGGNSKDKTWISTIGRLRETIKMHTNTDNKSNGNSIGYALNTSRINGIFVHEINGRGFSKNNTAKFLTSQIDIRQMTSSAVAVIIRENINGDFEIDFSTNAVGGTPQSLEASGTAIYEFISTASAGAISSPKTRAFIELITSTNSVARNFNAQFLKGVNYSNSEVKGISTLSKSDFIKGKIVFTLGDKAKTVKKQAVLSEGRSSWGFNNDGYIRKYITSPSGGQMKIKNSSSAQPVLWYPPIGDGIPLVEGQVEIPNYGQILEIQQAYQITIDHENGILEIDINNENEKLEVS